MFIWRRQGDLRGLLPLLSVPTPRDLDPALLNRIWLDKWHFTFAADDWFLGGDALGYDYQAAGITRDEAIAVLEQLDDRLWLAESDATGKRLGPLVEQPLEETGYRDSFDPDVGAFVYRQVGAILHLPPGDYLSVYEATFNGRRIDDAKVILHIVPSG